MSQRDFPLHVLGTRQCAQPDGEECVKAALQADPELDEPWERLRCNLYCEWEFFMGPALSGSHPHNHAPAFNALARGKHLALHNIELGLSYQHSQH